MQKNKKKMTKRCKKHAKNDTGMKKRYKKGVKRLK